MVRRTDLDSVFVIVVMFDNVSKDTSFFLSMSGVAYIRKLKATSGLYLPISMPRPTPILYFTPFRMNEEWLKFKKYPHIGLPLTINRDGNWIRDYVTNSANIANHKFVPLLHREISQRKYRPAQDAPKNESRKRQRTIKEKKTRHVYYPTHLDSIIYSCYNDKLMESYEEYLADKKYSNVAVAYRKIPVIKDQRSNKSNIEFAFEAFRFIEENQKRKMSVIVADVTSFFDNLDHRILHKQWKRVLKVDNLPDDHYAIYKSLVDFKYVNENELFKRFSNKLFVERFRPNDTSKKELKRKKVNKIYHLRQENVVAFCEKGEFFDEAADLIRVDKPYNKTLRQSLNKVSKKGIPQGTPISATLANIYMLDFDARVYAETVANSRNAFYQRYSDDLIVICDQCDEDFFVKLIQREIEDEANLDIQTKKTNIFRYEFNHVTNSLSGGIVIKGEVNSNKQLEYLGFSYDGLKIRVKSAGFSKFYRAMKRSFRRGAHFAKAAHIPSNALFETRLYKRFTHVGSKRRLKWMPDKKSSSGYSPSKFYDWGNFISYLNKANGVMKTINGDDSIAKQYSKVWKRFHKIKKSTYVDIGSIKK